jgi:hypothetical protein
MCQRRFVAVILSGAKPHTIRAERKRVIRVGDQLDLRAWKGAPYRSKQEKLRVVTVTAVRPIKITVFSRGIGEFVVAVAIEGKRITPQAMCALAHADGFANLANFAVFFFFTHGEIFTGHLIEWRT